MPQNDITPDLGYRVELPPVWTTNRVGPQAQRCKLQQSSRAAARGCVTIEERTTVRVQHWFAPALVLLACACSSDAGHSDVSVESPVGAPTQSGMPGSAAPASRPSASQPSASPPSAASSPSAPGTNLGAAGSSASATPAVATPTMGSSPSAAMGTAGAPSMATPQMATPPAAPPSDPNYPDIVFNMHGTIEAGAEAMFCQYVQMPKGVKTAVPSAESHYTPGSHHFLVFRTNLTSIPAGEDKSHLCGDPTNTLAVTGASNGLASGESAAGSTGSYYEAQTPNARRDLPAGVAHVFAPGEILILTAHYFNATEATIDSTIEFRLHTEDPALVKQEAGTFFLLDTNLNIPPHSEVTFTRACPIPKDINLGLLWSHMHARGWSFKASTDDPMAMAQLNGDVYDQPGPDGWAEPHVQTYPSDPPIVLHAGSKLTISCTYHNTTDQTFRFGQSAETSEMCLLHGMYYPRLDGATERCTNGTSTSGKSMPLSGN